MNPVQSVLETLDAIIKNVEKALTPPSSKDVADRTTSAKPGSQPISKNDGDRTVKAQGEESKAANGATTGEPNKKKKEKKPKAPPAPAIPPEVAQFLQCDLRIGRIVEVAHHPEADGLFVLKVSYGTLETRTVCAGLRNFLTDDEMRDRLVVTICNLKPRKLRGIDSEAMILAGSTKSDDGNKETVVPLVPPESAAEGDIVSTKDITNERNVERGKFVSGKVWDKVVPRLSVQDGKACYNSSPLAVEGNPVICELPDGAEIH